MTRIDGTLPFEKYLKRLGIFRRRRRTPELTEEAAARMKARVMAHFDEVTRDRKPSKPPDESDK